ncbi:hypothetical protein FRC19_003355 [Serendipita sp. 401]|nr:hypothetical protein FRC19_003355 [Serendipita sp. 401]
MSVNESSLWSPDNANEQSYPSFHSNYDGEAPTTSDADRIDYDIPKEAEEEALIEIPETETEQNEKMEEILANLRTVISKLEEESSFSNHVDQFIKKARENNLAGEEQPTTTDVTKMMKEFDSVSIADDRTV